MKDDDGLSLSIRPLCPPQIMHALLIAIIRREVLDYLSLRRLRLLVVVHRKIWIGLKQEEERW